ncbi:hypothetical protein CVN68_16770 [Sphingomonas psychrotolerans]|uniref:Uncharacterized protein n=2 Tax=Sphingomonas psychrotolerans TaxID=1327635 RepID=A0A2K8MHQ7_9SPHN|nr:hypothetical protein CVN68_16770 [Sphingomonas psychrotolerans]
MDIAKGIQALDTNAKVKLATIELMEKILTAQQEAFAAQQAQATLLERIRKLEADANRVSDWEQERARYELKEFPTGAMAYVLKGNVSDGEPGHRICPACYQDSRKSILQTISRGRGGEVVDCPRCEVRLTLVESAPIRIDASRTSGYY